MEPQWDYVIARVNRGWIKNCLESGGSVCLMGGVLAAEEGSFNLVKATQPYLDVMVPIIKAEYPERVFRINNDWHTAVDFNNHPKTTKEDVIKVLEKARANG